MYVCNFIDIIHIPVVYEEAVIIHLYCPLVKLFEDLGWLVEIRFLCFWRHYGWLHGMVEQCASVYLPILCKKLDIKSRILRKRRKQICKHKHVCVRKEQLVQCTWALLCTFLAINNSISCPCLSNIFAVLVFSSVAILSIITFSFSSRVRRKWSSILSLSAMRFGVDPDIDMCSKLLSKSAAARSFSEEIVSSSFRISFSLSSSRNLCNLSSSSLCLDSRTDWASNTPLVSKSFKAKQNNL